MVSPNAVADASALSSYAFDTLVANPTMSADQAYSIAYAAQVIGQQVSAGTVSLGQAIATVDAAGAVSGSPIANRVMPPVDSQPNTAPGIYLPSGKVALPSLGSTVVVTPTGFIPVSVYDPAMVPLTGNQAAAMASTYLMGILKSRPQMDSLSAYRLVYLVQSQGQKIVDGSLSVNSLIGSLNSIAASAPDYNLAPASGLQLPNYIHGSSPPALPKVYTDVPTRPKITPPNTGSGGLLALVNLSPNGRTFGEITDAGGYLSLEEREWYLNQIGKTVDPITGAAVDMKVYAAKAPVQVGSMVIPKALPNGDVGSYVTLSPDVVAAIQTIFPPDEWRTAFMIAAVENNGNATGANPSSGASGLFQILPSNFGTFTFLNHTTGQYETLTIDSSNASDPYVNTAKAEQLWRNSNGWGATITPGIAWTGSPWEAAPNVFNYFLKNP